MNSIAWNGTTYGTGMEPCGTGGVKEVPLVPVQFRYKFRYKSFILRTSSAGSAFLEKLVNASFTFSGAHFFETLLFTCLVRRAGVRPIPANDQLMRERKRLK